MFKSDKSEYIISFDAAESDAMIAKAECQEDEAKGQQRGRCIMSTVRHRLHHLVSTIGHVHEGAGHNGHDGGAHVSLGSWRSNDGWHLLVLCHIWRCDDYSGNSTYLLP